MAEISAKLVKELRDRTQLPMMECKKALAEAEGITEVTKALSKEYVQYEMVKRRNGDVPQINGWGNNFLLDIGEMVK